jgi:ATP-dependent RNA helicase RhlE
MNRRPHKRKTRFGQRNRKNVDSRTQRKDYSKYINKHAAVNEEVASYESNNEFFDFELDESLLKLIRNKNYQQPTEIQDRAIPSVLEGRDIVGIAGTGTGKTAAFVIPLVEQLISEPVNNYALIIAPTRELASQINTEWRSLTRGMNLYSTCLIGGASMSESIRSLKKTNHLVVGTPGRLLDMSRRGLLRFENFKVLVLDEFDRMLDMGFSKDIQSIHEQMVNKQQTLLFSATIDKDQDRLIREMTSDPLRITINQPQDASARVEQDVFHVNGLDKFEAVKGIIDAPENRKTLLFCETKRNADKILKRLNAQNIQTDVIHGDKTQRVREKALRKFRNGQIRVLVATDVVARGIDVSDVDLVSNYEIPRNYTDYIHRIGRTGRAGKTGRAITMVD